MHNQRAKKEVELEVAGKAEEEMEKDELFQRVTSPLAGRLSHFSQLSCTSLIMSGLLNYNKQLFMYNVAVSDVLFFCATSWALVRGNNLS